jgi:1-pyrroline-5-carboxylate dehydrogenase
MQRCVVKYFGQLSCRKKMLWSDGLDLYSALIIGQRHSSMLSFATVDPVEVSCSHPGQMYNLVQGKWQGTSKWAELLDPLNGEKFIRVPDTSNSESQVCSLHSSSNVFFL